MSSKNGPHLGNVEGGSTSNIGHDAENYVAALLGARRIKDDQEPYDLFLGVDEGYPCSIGMEVKSALNRYNPYMKKKMWSTK